MSVDCSYCCNYCEGRRPKIVVQGIRDWEYGAVGNYDYYECQDCKGVQLHPFPNMELLKEAYDVDYHGYSVKEKRGFVFSVLYWLKESLFRRKMSGLIQADAKVLDIGCGAGEFLLGLKSLGVDQLDGIDFNEKVVEGLNQSGINGFAGTFEEFSSDNDVYDLIAMNNYLEHTLDPVFELKKTFQLLKRGGYLVGELPGFDSVDRRIFGRYWGGNHVPRHTFQFSSRFLERILKGAGFADVRITHELNTSHWALSVQNVLQRNVADLRHNPAVSHGRSAYYFPLLLTFLPLNVFCVLARKSGCVKFYAQKPSL